MGNEAVSGIETLSYLNQQGPHKPIVVRSPRDPTGDDKQFTVGTLWINEVSNHVYQLTSVSGGISNWEPLSQSAGGNAPITNFVVSQDGTGDYTTIQAALNRANVVGGGVVYVRPGTYTENLTFYPNTEVVGTSGTPELQQIIIVGTHIPSSTGFCGITNAVLRSSINIFSSAAGNLSTVICQSCLFDVTNGYTFDLPNWGGQCTINDSHAIGVNDGVLNNPSGGMSLFTKNSLVGAGSANTLIVNNNCRLETTEFKCPVAMGGTGSSEINVCIFKETLFFSGSHAATIFKTNFQTISNIAISHNSSSTVVIESAVIDSSAANVIAGTGTIDAGAIIFRSSRTIQGTISISFNFEQSGIFLGQAITFDNGVNLLDHYENGTFTPVLEFGGGTTGITYTAQVGVFTRIGKKVFCDIEIILTNKGSAIGPATISGLPFLVAGGGQGVAKWGVIDNINWPTIPVSFLTGIVSATGQEVQMTVSPTGGLTIPLTNSQFNNNTAFFIEASYLTV